MKEQQRGDLAQILANAQKQRATSAVKVGEKAQESMQPENRVESNKNASKAVSNFNERSVVQRKFWAVILTTSNSVIFESLESKRETIENVDKLLSRPVLFGKYLTQNIVSLQIFHNEKQALTAAKTLKSQLTPTEIVEAPTKKSGKKEEAEGEDK